MEVIKILSLFSGIGAFEKALRNLGAKYELAGYSEIDRYASEAYALIHGVSETLNLGDISQIDEITLPADIDLITYGFPCQDISISGYQKGFTDEAGARTRSGLFFDALRIIRHCQPRVAIAENVKNLTSKRMAAEFNAVQNGLAEAGYNFYWKVLDARDYGIPQHRERVFIVSIRKDIDDGGFIWPKPVPLTKCVADYLEEKVPDSYYLSTKQLEWMQTSAFSKKHPSILKGGEIATLKSCDYKYRKCVQVADLHYYKNDQMNRVYGADGSAPTLVSVSGGADK